MSPHAQNLNNTLVALSVFLHRTGNYLVNKAML